MDVSGGFRQKPGWLAAVAVLLAGQALLTLRLFSPELSPELLLNDEPLVSGRHPLHYYHGSIGARTWHERGDSCCFDPAYQAGYPKTPVFDGGSRPAELFQLLGGRRAASYKLGLAICCALAPLAFVAAARGAGLTAGAATLAGLLGGILWWSNPVQALLRAGDVDLLLGGLCVLLHVTWFVRFDRHPGLDSWLVMTITAGLAWYTQPLLVVGFLPFQLFYYLWVATRQGLIWHLSLFAAAAVAFGPNAAWLSDWFHHLWLYLPLGGQNMPSTPFWPTVAKQWQSMLPLDPLVGGTAAIGFVGLMMMLKGNRACAFLMALGAAEFMFFACAGRFWMLLADYGAEKFTVLAVWCIVLPAAHALASIAEHLGKASVWPPLGAVGVGTALLGAAYAIDVPRELTDQPALEIGLGDPRTQLVETLTAKTTPDARILWEDRPDSNWTALLAMQTDRAYLGGLDPEGRVEHMYARLADGKLGGRPLFMWADSQLRDFAEKYNVGWVACWTPDAVRRWQAAPFARKVGDLHDGQAEGVLFKLDRRPSFFLKGRGQWALADTTRVALADVTPEDGEIVLSLHHQSKMRVSPGYVQIERVVDVDDPIPFVRLRVPGPVARVSIVWDNP